MQMVWREQISLICHAARDNNPPILLVALVLWTFLYFQTGELSAIAWGVGMHATQMTRSWWLGRYFFSADRAAQDTRWFRGAIALIGANGLAWGLAPLLFIGPTDLMTNFIVVVVILAILSGGLTWMTPVRPAMLAFSLPILLLTYLALVQQQALVYRAVALLTCIYLYTILKVTLQHNRMIEESLRNRFANHVLNEKLLKQVQLVEKANTEKSRFLAAASHDLRQPATAIALFSDALERNLTGKPEHEDARRTKQAARALGQALESMLDISRLDAGAVLPQMGTVSVQQVFQQLNQTFSTQADANGLELRVRATDLWIRSDRQLLDRMLGNLVSNAIKYTEHGGILVVARRHGTVVHIEIIDTGVGIAPMHLDKIFDEFYQVDNPGRDRSRGLGIGLSIVQRLARLLDHSVQVRSVPARGTRFRISAANMLPGSDAETRLHTHPLRSGANRLPRHVLVLDDEADIVDAMASMLASYGVKVTRCTTVEQAYAALAETDPQEPIEVFLCDVRLGDGVDGLDLVQSLNVTDGPILRIVLMTGETAPHDIRRLRASGYPVLSKPVTPALLIAELRIAL